MTPTSEVIRLAKLAGFDASYTTPSGLEYVLAITELDEVNIFDQVARLISLAKAEALAEGWQPIETVPKDTAILLGPTKRMGICVGMHHSRDGWVTETPSEWVPIYPPTHWRPLPPPPKEAP